MEDAFQPPHPSSSGCSTSSYHSACSQSQASGSQHSNNTVVLGHSTSSNSSKKPEEMDLGLKVAIGLGGSLKTNVGGGTSSGMGNTGQIVGSKRSGGAGRSGGKRGVKRL